MSQAGQAGDGSGTPIDPQIPTQFDSDVGNAIPIANILNILGDTQAAGTTPVHTTGAGNTITTIVQLAQSNAFSSATTAGLATFDSGDFTVDANGFVSLAGGPGGAVQTLGVQATSGTGTDPVVPDGAGNIDIAASVTVAGTTPMRSISTAANSLNIQTQMSQAIAATDGTKVGLCNFDSAAFAVDINGFVTLAGGGQAIDSVAVQATSGGGTNPVVPTVAGLLTLSGALVAAGTNPIRSVSTAANTIEMQAQTSQALAAGDSTKVGFCNFDSTAFAVSAAGFVTLVGGAGAGTITGDTGGALPQTANNWNIVSTATNGIETTGAGSTLTIGMASPFADGSFAFSRSAAGAINTLTVANTSTAAGSDALQQVTVAGTAAGDPYTTYTVTGGSSWSQGIDNSAADSFKTSVGTVLGTTDVWVVTTGGSATLNNVATSAEMTLQALNSDTNAASNSRVSAAVVNASAADPYFQVSVNATSNYCFGIDNSNLDTLKINFDANAATATPSGGANLWNMTTAGENTRPLQPAFLAYVNTAINNVTGDATTYTIIFDTEVYDQNNDFALATSIFTAPVTGKYHFDFGVLLGGGTIMSLAFCQIVTTAKTYQRSMPTNAGATTSCTGVHTIMLDMIAGDTATFNVTATDTGGKVDDVSGATGAVQRTWINGWLEV